MKMSPQYSRLQTAISAAEMQKRLQQALVKIRGEKIELENFNVTRVFPRADGSITIQYRINALTKIGQNNSPVILCGHLLGETDDWPGYINPNKKQVMIFDDLRLIIPVFPFDPQLPVISQLWVKGKLPQVLQKAASSAVANLPNAGIVDLEVLGYRLERRCVIRHTLGELGNTAENRKSFEIVTKIARPAKIMETAKCQLLLEQNGFAGSDNNDLSIPNVLHIDAKNGLQISELSPGETLHNLTGDKSFIRGCEKAALLLQKLHSVDSGSLPKYSYNDELKSLEKRIKLFSSIFPEFDSSFESVLLSLKMSSRELGNEYANSCVHGDFYDKQILSSDGRSTLLDFDSLVSGDPARDFGNFSAHLKLRQLQEPTHTENINKGMQVFKSAYGFPDKKFTERVSWWQAAALLRLACLYSLRPKWQMLTKDLVNSAISIIQIHHTQTKGVKENYVL